MKTYLPMPETSNWPLPKFHFSVDFGNITNIPFQEVSGLETETQIIEYRHSASPSFSAIKMPGIVKVGNVTFKRGVFVNDNSFWNWLNNIKMNVVKRQNITVKLLDESGSPTMTWILQNAWPTKISATDLKSDGNEVAIEVIEVAHEGLVIHNG